MKNRKYFGKTYSQVMGKVNIASDKIFDAIDLIQSDASPYNMKDKERLIKKFNRAFDILDKLGEEFERVDEKYFRK